MKAWFRGYGGHREKIRDRIYGPSRGLKDNDTEGYNHIFKILNEALGELEKKLGSNIKSLKTSATLAEDDRGFQFLNVQAAYDHSGEIIQVPIAILRAKAVLLGLINSSVQQKRKEGYSNLWFP